MHISNGGKVAKNVMKRYKKNYDIKMNRSAKNPATAHKLDLCGALGGKMDNVHRKI